MFVKEVGKYIANPISGMLSFVLFILLDAYVVPQPGAFFITLAVIPIFQVAFSRNLELRIQYVLTFHVVLVTAYKQITIGYMNESIEDFIYYVVPVLIIAGLCIYQVFRTNYTIKKLKNEEWIPIVTEEGEVTGRIAKAVSVNLKNKFLHPVVRIALVCNGKIFLQKRDGSAVLDPSKIDHPFEKYMLFKHEVSLAAHNSIKQVLGRDIENTKFVFKYVFENNVTKRLIFLFVAELEDESEVVRTEKMRGKFWTVKQIDEEFNNQIFSECFELEYEYLKHVVLLEDADRLTNMVGMEL